MTKPRRSPRLTALFAAYSLALQALLLPLSVAAAAPFAAGLCATSHEGAPASHETGCPCAAGCGMQCCTQALATPPAVAMAMVEFRVAGVIFASALPLPDRSAAWHPNIARAPPAA